MVNNKYQYKHIIFLVENAIFFSVIHNSQREAICIGRKGTMQLKLFSIYLVYFASLRFFIRRSWLPLSSSFSLYYLHSIASFR